MLRCAVPTQKRAYSRDRVAAFGAEAEKRGDVVGAGQCCAADNAKINLARTTVAKQCFLGAGEVMHGIAAQLARSDCA